MGNHVTEYEAGLVTIEGQRLWKWHGYLARGCLMGLMAFLPFAHITWFISGALIGLGLCVVLRWWLERKVSLPSTSINAPLLLFSVWVILSLITATDLTYSLFQVKNQLFPNLLIFYSVLFFIRNRDDVKMLLPFLYLGLLVMSLYGCFEFWQKNGNLLTRSVRIGSLTSDYIYLSTYLLLAIPMAFLGLLLPGRGFVKGTMILLFFLSLVCMFLTFTRIAWAALVLQFLFYGLVRNRVVFGIGLGMIVLVGLLSLFSPLIRQAVMTYGEVKPDEKVEGFERRVEVWKFAIQEMVRHPLTGIGYGRDTIRKVYDGNRIIDRDWWHTFNSFLDLGVEIGAPGLLLFLWVLYSLWRVLWEGMKQGDSYDSLFCMALLMIMVGYFVRNQVDHVYVNFPAQLFWLFMGLGVKLRLLQQTS